MKSATEKVTVHYVNCPGVLDRVACILARDFDRWLREEGRGGGVRCERCGGHTDDPVKDGNRWICDSCARLLFESAGWNTD